MDHSIKKKPEKPRMRGRRTDFGEKWLCWCNVVMAADNTGTEAYQEWQRTRAALNKHEGKS